MAAHFDAKTRPRVALRDDHITELLGDGNQSEIEEFDDDDEEFQPVASNRLQNDGVQSGKESSDENETKECEEPPTIIQAKTSKGIPAARGRPSSPSRGVPASQPRDISTSQPRGRSASRPRDSQPRGRLASQSLPRPEVRPAKQPVGRVPSRKRIWKEVLFNDQPHNYSVLPINPVRRPIDYYRDYFDNEFLEEVARCTNMYYMRTTGRELKTTRVEIAKLFAIHLIMGCIPYPRMPMYWRAGTKLELICGTMSRDRFLAVRDALHVVDRETPSEADRENPLWKVEPMIKKVKDTCNQLERVPGFYSIDEQMIPFTGRCKLRQVVKNKPRPVGLKNFVLTTTEGLMLDFAIYRGAKTMFCDTALGLGPSVILLLSQSIPPGSCVNYDRYFTTVLLIEEMRKRNLHSTGTIMQNRIPDRATIKFKKDSQMARGETQQFVSDPTAIVKWKDNKSVLMASNCSGSGESTHVQRWDKTTKTYSDISAPRVIKLYNQHMGGVDVLDQQMEYYRTFIKTKKWTLKVLIHFLDLAVVNSWRLYKNDCTANGLPRKDTMTLLDFRMDIADTLKNLRETEQSGNEENESLQLSRRDYKIYRPSIRPSEGKRYDGYYHLPISDNIKAPRSCRMERCGSRSKIRCEKCDVYLCLSRDKNCFSAYHKKKLVPTSRLHLS